MNREEYISYLRGNNTLMIAYKHYVLLGKKPLLEVGAFGVLLQQWMNMKNINMLDKLISNYNTYFNIVFLFDKEENLISIL